MALLVRRKLVSILVCLLPLAVSACAAGGPPKEALIASLSAQIPEMWEVADLTIEASENDGTRVEPHIVARFSAQLRLKSPTYSVTRDTLPRRSPHEFALLLRVKDTGYVVRVYGIATSVRWGDSWRTTIRLQEEIPEVGQPRAVLNQRYEKTVLIGGAEEAAFIAQLEKDREAELSAQRTAITEWIVGEHDGTLSTMIGGWNADRFPFRLTISSISAAGNGPGVVDFVKPRGMGWAGDLPQYSVEVSLGPTTLRYDKSGSTPVVIRRTNVLRPGTVQLASTTAKLLPGVWNLELNTGDGQLRELRGKFNGSSNSEHTVDITVP